MGKETQTISTPFLQENSLEAAGGGLTGTGFLIPEKRVFIPISALLERPLIIDKSSSEAWESFHRLADSRVTYRSQREHYSFGRNAFWPKWTPSSACVVYGFKIPENGPKIQIIAFEISINRDALRGRYQGLEPYLIEHEIHEVWLDIKAGFSPDDTITRLPIGLTISNNLRHWSAVQKTFKMAEQDGRLEDLLKFSLREYSPLSLGHILHRPTLEKIYNKVKIGSRKTSPTPPA